MYNILSLLGYGLGLFGILTGQDLTISSLMIAYGAIGDIEARMISLEER